MPLQVIGQAQIVDAINGFSADYHSDYFWVRDLGREYLERPVSK